MKPFTLLVKPASADCNLRCTYCFYLDRCGLYPENPRHRMTHAVLERMISSYMSTSQPVYGFGWQGGEPTLMGDGFFEDVTTLQSRYGRPGAVVSNGLQTNGTLIDDSLAQHLARYRFLTGISLDGPAEIHDSQRVTIDGRGSHHDVMRGIATLRRNGADFNILTLVSQANVKQPELIYRYMCDEGFLFQQYIECVEADASGNLRPYSLRGAEWGEFLCRLFDLWFANDTRRVSIRMFDSILARLVDGVPNVCHIGTDCRQYLVVEHNGDVYPCDFYVEKDLRLGNVMTDSWERMLESPVYKAFGLRKRRWPDECTKCSFRYICAGDCPKNRLCSGLDEGRLSVLCAGWQVFYEHTLERFKALAAEIRQERSIAQAGGDRAQPVLNMPPGRNDPCPCGSGRKYKRCCG